MKKYSTATYDPNMKCFTTPEGETFTSDYSFKKSEGVAIIYDKTDMSTNEKGKSFLSKNDFISAYTYNISSPEEKTYYLGVNENYIDKFLGSVSVAAALMKILNIDRNKYAIILDYLKTQTADKNPLFMRISPVDLVRVEVAYLNDLATVLPTEAAKHYRATNDDILKARNISVVEEIISSVGKIVIKIDGKLDEYFLDGKSGKLFLPNKTIKKILEIIDLSIAAGVFHMLVFEFKGAAGTGKTYTAEEIAMKYYGLKPGEGVMTIVPTNFSSPDDIFTRVAARRSANGDDFIRVPTELTEFLRRDTFKILILEEITRARDDIKNAFLTVLSGNSYNDHGVDVYIGKQTVILATSNDGSKGGYNTQRNDTAFANRVHGYVKLDYADEGFTLFEKDIIHKFISEGVERYTEIGEAIYDGISSIRRGLKELGVEQEHVFSLRNTINTMQFLGLLSGKKSTLKDYIDMVLMVFDLCFFDGFEDIHSDVATSLRSAFESNLKVKFSFK